MLTLLLALFPADGLGDPRFAVREATTRALVRVWPLSEPSLRYAERRPDAEVSARAAAVRGAQLRRPGRRGLALLLQPFTPDELRALAVVADPHESDGLPWASAGDHRRWGDTTLRRGLVGAQRKLRLLPEKVLGLDPDLGESFPTTSCLPGLDALRFAFRGLPEPTCANLDECRKQWAETKPK